MTNEAYIHSLDIPQEAQETCLKAMEKYGDNHWWEPGVDNRTFAYWQTKEPIHLIHGMERYADGLVSLLGRPLLPPEVELCPSNEAALIAECEMAWQFGTPYYSDEKVSRIHLERVLTARKDGLHVSVIDLSELAAMQNMLN